MAFERLYLDPVEIDSTRTEFAIHGGTNISVAEAGPNWGDAAIEQYMTEMLYGQLPVDFRIPNRQVVIPLLVYASAGTTFETARRQLQQKAALLQSEGGSLKRVLGNGRKVYLDVVGATLRMGGSTLQAAYDIEVDAELTLETLPDWYGDTESSGPFSALTNFITNPSFEADVLPWEYSTVAGDFSTRSGTVGADNVAVHGLKALYLLDSVTGGRNTRYVRLPAANWIVSTVGLEAVFACSVLIVDAPVDGFGAEITFYRVDRTTITATLRGTVTRATSGRVTISVIGVIPANTAYAQPRIAVNLNGGGTDRVELYFDDMFFSQAASFASVVPDYFDGDTPGSTWKGIQHASTSTHSVPKVRVLVDGDYPSRCQLDIVNSTSFDQRGALFAIRPEERAVTAAMDLPATGLTLLGGTVYETDDSGEAGVTCRSLPATRWLAVLSNKIDGNAGGYLSHIGAHRCWALVRATGIVTNGAQLAVRMDWSVGSAATVTSNLERFIVNGLFWVDLGQVNIPKLGSGPQRWEGRLLVKAPEAGVSVRIIRRLVLPVSYGYGQINADSSVSDPSTVTAWDEFIYGGAGDLDSNVAPLGGTWTHVRGFNAHNLLEATGYVYSLDQIDNPDVTRQTVWWHSGEFYLLGTTRASYTDLEAQVYCSIPTQMTRTSLVAGGLLARYVDPTHFVAAFPINMVIEGFDPAYTLNGVYIIVVDGSPGAGSDPVRISLIANWYGSGYNTSIRRLRLIVTRDGWAYLDVDGVRTLSLFNSALATGGSLDDGQFGLYDYAFSGNAGQSSERRYYNFSASVSDAVSDSVLYAIREATLAYNGYRRADANRAYAPIMIDGINPRLPVSGIEGRRAEIYLRYMRGPIGQIGANGIQDPYTITVGGRPCYFFTPDPT